jgi:hypothetical protein
MIQFGWEQGVAKNKRGLWNTGTSGFGAREWSRTITALRPLDFESSASASSATRARRQDITGLKPYVQVFWSAAEHSIRS